MMRCIFVTGTDTEIGKTQVAVALLKLLREGYQQRTIAWKPVAAGCEQESKAATGRWQNEDAIALQAVVTEPMPYDDVNPIALAEPIAPHLAAANTGRELSVRALAQHWQQLQQKYQADWCVVEGAGGWELPLNATERMPDWVLRAQLPVVLVVGLRLGCLNHALLTVARIQQQGGHCVGWVSNEPAATTMARQAANIDTLATQLPCPRLGHLPFGSPGLHLTPAGQQWLSAATRKPA